MFNCEKKKKKKTSRLHDVRKILNPIYHNNNVIFVRKPPQISETQIQCYSLDNAGNGGTNSTGEYRKKYRRRVRKCLDT